MNQKKSVIGPVISVFVMVLVISILAGLTFLFVAQLKTNAFDTSTKTAVAVTNETGAINATGYTLTAATLLGFSSPVIVYATNATGAEIITSANYTVSSTGVVTNLTAETFPEVNFSYTYNYIAAEDSRAYLSINDTEAAGATVVNYLALIFLAVIFGALLTVVLRTILPYINLGQKMGGF